MRRPCLQSVDRRPRLQTPRWTTHWLVGRPKFGSNGFFTNRIWYKCKVHYGQKCEYVVQSTKDSIARFPVSTSSFLRIWFQYEGRSRLATYIFRHEQHYDLAHTKSIKCGNIHDQQMLSWLNGLRESSLVLLCSTKGKFKELSFSGRIVQDVGTEFYGSVRSVLSGSFTFSSFNELTHHTTRNALENSNENSNTKGTSSALR